MSIWSSINFPTLIRLPTVFYFSRENPLVKPTGLGSLLHHICLCDLFSFAFIFSSIKPKISCCTLFYLRSIYPIYYNFTLSPRQFLAPLPERDWQPLFALVARIYLFCAGARDSRVASYWIDTMVLKNWGKYLRYSAASSFPLWEIQHKLKR